MVLHYIYILRPYDQVKPKFLVKGTSGQPSCYRQGCSACAFFLAARQRKVTKTYDCRGIKKGGGKRLSGRSRLGNKGSMLSSEGSDGFDPAALTL
jgi:hypothetical protein